MSRFRLIDLITAGGCAALPLGLTIVGRQQAQEFNAISECAVNLKRIGQALLQYQDLSNGTFPRTRYEADRPITAYTGATSPDPFSPAGPAVNDVTAAAFLLARVVDLPADAFICAAAQRHGLAETDTFTPATVSQRSNFSARIHYNYALANMYPDTASVAGGYSLDRYTQRLPKDFVIAADTNPGGEGVASATPNLSPMKMRMSNSPNHQREGQNVLFAAGNVQFTPTPFVGVAKDNLYASQGTYPTPGNVSDSVILPNWSMGPQTIPTSVRLRRWVFGSAMVIVTIGLFVFVMRNRHRPASTTSSHGID